MLHAAILESIVLLGLKRSQHAIFQLLQACQKELDESGCTGTVLLDLSEAYQCLPYYLIIAKLEAYGFDSISLELFHSYFPKQQVKIDSAISEWIDILTSIPQGSILGPLIFNILFNNFIVFFGKTGKFSDNNTLYKSSTTFSVVLKCLEHDISIVLNWFNINSLKVNPKKFEFTVLRGKKVSRLSAKLKTLIYAYTKLTFEDHIEKLCKKASCKLYVFQRIRKFLTMMPAKALAS